MRLLLVLLVLAPALRAHPAHTAHAEIDFRRDPGRLEISVRAGADDLLAALRTAAGPAGDLDPAPSAAPDPRLLALVRAGLELVDRHGAAVALRGVGQELDAEDGHGRIWIHLEAALPDGVEGMRVRFGLLHDAFPRQRNTVRVRDGARETTLAFAPGDGFRVVHLGP